VSTSVDTQNLTLTVSTELSATPERAWQLWADPRQFERWWGAPGYPAQVHSLDLRTGGKIEYHLSGPDGDTPTNIWDVVEADPPRRIVVRDAIVDDNDVPVDEGPSSFTITLEPIADGHTRMSIVSKFPSEASLEMSLKMDMDKMFEWSFSQMEAVLAESPTPVA
jgi:uncharacterized protein YndB with AHSA1/START domain